MGAVFAKLDLDTRTATGLLVCMALVRWVRSKRRVNPDQHYIVKEPSEPYQLITQTPPAKIELGDVASVAKEMRMAFDSGISRPVATRKAQIKRLLQLFTDNEEILVEALQKDLGRPRNECLIYDLWTPMSEIKHVLAHLDDWVSPDTKGFDLLTFPSYNQLHHEPKGVVLVIGTWNYPIMLSLVPVLGALAAGNTVILKPCVVSSHVARCLGELIPRYLDRRIVTVVGQDMPGDRHCTAELLKCKFDHIFFTGSPSVGKVIMRGAAEHLTPVTLELGGKNPVFVDPSADLDLAAKRSVWGRNMNAGQQCISPDFVLCHASVADQFAERCKYWVGELYGKNPRDSIGRIVGTKQMERIKGLLRRHGGEVVAGGHFDDEAKYIAPTVLRVSFDSPIMEEEIFGPILLIVSVASMEAAITYVNTRPKPLSLYIFSNDQAITDKIVHNTSSGGVTVNGTLFHCAHPELPFGGVGDSGMGAYHGKATFEIFSHPKPVLKKLWLPDGGLLSDPFFIYPPWTDLKLKICRVLFKF